MKLEEWSLLMRIAGFLFVILILLEILNGNGGISQEPAQASELFEQAQKAESDQEKIVYLEKAIQIDPKYLKAVVALGEIYLRTGEYTKARDLLSKAIIGDSQNALALELLGDVHVKLDNKKEAKTFYETALQRDPTNSSLLLKIVEIELALNHLNEAERKIKQYFTEFNITNPDAWYCWGKLNFQKKDYIEAKNGYRSALKYDSTHVKALAGLKHLGKMQQLHAREQELQTAIENEALDLVRQKIKEIKELDAEYVELSAWNQQIAALFFRLGKAALDANDKTQAYHLLSSVLEFDPHYPGVDPFIRSLEKELDQEEILAQYYQQGYQAVQDQRWAVAIQAFEQVVAINPDYRQVKMLLARARQNVKPSDKPAPQRRDQISPAARQHYQDGLSFCQRNQWQAAVEQFQKALDLAPAFNNAKAMHLFALGSVDLDNKEWKPAQIKFEAALQFAPNDSLIQAAHLYTQTQINFAERDYSAAQHSLNQLKQLGIQFRDTDTLGNELQQALAREQQKASTFLSQLLKLLPWLTGVFLILIIVFIIRTRKKRVAGAPIVRSEAQLKSPPAKRIRRKSGEIETVVQKVFDKKVSTTDSILFGEDQGVFLVESSTSPEEQEILFYESGLHPRRRRGRYEVKEQIGQGAMGKVYRAYDHKMERMIVLKEIHLDKTLSQREYEKLTQRFLREARSAGRLYHPNIVTIFDIISEGGNLYISMEYLDGVNLLKLIKEKQLPPPRQVVDIIRQAANALYFAHQAGIIHRDIKPSNIMLMPNGQIKIVDFGVAKVADSTTLTQIGSSLGTPSYMSPEQIDGKHVDGRSDIFSLGVVFYELLTGTRPFQGDTMASIIVNIMKATPPRITELRQELPQCLERIVSKMLHKNPDNRYRTAIALVRDLDEADKVL